MNYYDIGQRIRKYRKAAGLSQEKLAEIINISTTHMSHIETGNTKMSLSVFVDIASALQVRSDDLLYDTPPDVKTVSAEEICYALEKCSVIEARIIGDVVKALKVSFDKHF